MMNTGQCCLHHLIEASERWLPPLKTVSSQEIPAVMHAMGNPIMKIHRGNVSGYGNDTTSKV